MSFRFNPITSQLDLIGGVPSGVYLTVANNLSDLANAVTARSNIGLGNVENTALSTWAGTTNIVTVGTITTGLWHGTKISEVYGGTNQSSYTLGDTLYASAANTLSKLAGNTTTTRKFLRQTGDGVNSAAPAWDTVTSTDVGLSNVENTALSTWAGSTNITTLGTITTGTWTGTSISTTYTDAKLKTLTGTANRITIGGTSTDPTIDISTSYVGQNTITTLGTIATGLWNGTKISETYGGTNQSTYTLGDILFASASNTLSKLNGNTTTTRKFLRQTGDGVSSAAPAWDTILAADIPGSALTKTDDTNITLTLGGSPTTALLNAASLTLGWTGQLALTRGGTNANLTASNGGIFYSTATAGAILSGTATAGQMLRSGASTAPTWSTATFPATASSAGTILRADGTNWVASTATYPNTTTVNRLLWSSSTNVISDLATANSGVLITSAGGVPSIATDIPTAVTIGTAYIYRVGGTDVSVADGGTGVSTLAAHGVVIGNGTSAVAVTSAGTADQVLTSNGASADPTFQTIPTATSSTVVLGSNFTLSASNGTYQDTGLAITLPTAGTYLILCDVISAIQVDSGTDGYIGVKLYNSTDGADVSNTERFGAYQYTATAVNGFETVSINLVLPVAASKTIKLYAAVFNGSTYSYRVVQSDSAGRTTMTYVKISNN